MTIGRIGIVLALIVYGVLAIGNGLDRQAYYEPAAARSVPDFFSYNALRQDAQKALSTRHIQLSLAVGKALVERAPNDPQSVALLGGAKWEAGDRFGSEQAFKVAGQMGWRVPLTQIYWLDRALEVKDYKVASMRFDALLRQQPSFHRIDMLVTPFETIPAARAALIERVRSRPQWLSDYAGDVADLSATAMSRRTQMLIALARARMLYGCKAIAPSVNRLDVVKLPREAQAVWNAHCPEGAIGLIGDEAFNYLDLNARISAFSWEAIGNGNLLLGLGPSLERNSRRLTIEGTAAITTPFLSLQRSLPEGRYRLSWASGSTQGQQPTGKIRSSMTCQGASEGWLDASLDQATRRWTAEFDVPASCPLQTIRFAVVNLSGSHWIERIRLESLHPTAVP